ncbi:holo-[acyl-carrier-protein] synthase [Spizellomyces sp. 'palustris']|nr:holo-[acyl-carrier-protein] synthase [Spizellomyces sp. 'palustris']
MPIIGIGVDTCHLPHLHSLLTRHSPWRLVRRIFTVRERELFEQNFGALDLHRPLPKYPDSDGGAHWNRIPPPQRRLLSYLGGRWAAKEAAFKALYPTYHLQFRDVSILKEQGPKPCIVLSPDIVKTANYLNDFAMSKPVPSSGKNERVRTNRAFASYQGCNASNPVASTSAQSAKPMGPFMDGTVK